MKYVIKLSPEITIKSSPVRKRAVKMLVKNIKIFLKEFKDTIKVKYLWDRIDLEIKNEKDISIKQIERIISQIPWIWKFSQVIEYRLLFWREGKEKIFDDVFEKIKDIFIEKIVGKTFVVRIKRAGEHIFSSTDMERYLWGKFLEAVDNTRVQLRWADVTVELEIKDDKIFVIRETYKWIGGYPTGFQEKILSLISGGFDSWVSTYQMMKRWCQVDFLFFNLWWNAHEIGVKQVAYYLWNNFSKPYKARFMTIPFEPIIAELLTKGNSRFRGILLKRFMLRVASKFIGFYAITKWDSLGQVSSQTLKNMHVIDKASDNLVLRPLISFDKEEIIDISKKIGTYNFACNMPEYCWIISDKPATWARLEQILEEEEKFDMSILNMAFENRQVTKISEVLKSIDTQFDNEDVEVSFLPWDGEIVVDIREDKKIKKSPLKLEKTEILEIPFFEINHKFKELNKEKTYLFYCDKWVLSKLHSLYLKEKGFTNIKIFRPIVQEISCSKD